MASRIHNFCLVMVLAVVLAKAKAQLNCTSVLVGMAPCLSYVTGSSSTPSPSCCTQLANVVQSQPRCLCTVLNGGGGSLGITINQTQALALPDACKVKTPPASQCNAANGPAASPTESSAGSPEAVAGDDSNHNLNGSSLTGPGSKTVPSTRGISGDGTVMKPLQPVLFFSAASYIALSIF